MRKGLIGFAATLVIFGGWLLLDGAGLFLPSAGTPLTIGNPAQEQSHWTVEEETATSGPWQGMLQMRYKPIAPLVRNHHSQSQFDVVWSEQLQYHGLFPPTLLQWPEDITWPKGIAGGGTQGTPIQPMRLRLGTFLYANTLTKYPDMLISLTQLQTAFDSVKYDIVWRGFTVLPPTRLWSVGPVHTRSVTLKTSLR
ncbi:MAG: hypothetical protein C7B46_02395 [Sulfobacillus benefaciens]|uniref:Uncharacterized protein n=1 Tax=Sulfobacillus benefaciens TaxID=453960 RepID=A0A2T2XKS8_9FIRM|nr:MAG: hypothetical protein C7B46_02395 [Sulfobacillus benefaciens]